MAEQLYSFLVEFLADRPELAGRDFYVTGESYAGHYVPAIGWKIASENAGGKAKAHINLKGIAIGNGLVEPLTQYGAYADFAFGNGLISKQQRDAVNAAYTSTCAPAIKQCQQEQRALRLGATPPHGDGAGGSFDCVTAVDVCNAGCVLGVGSSLPAPLACSPTRTRAVRPSPRPQGRAAGPAVLRRHQGPLHQRLRHSRRRASPPTRSHRPAPLPHPHPLSPASPASFPQSAPIRPSATTSPTWTPI